jgi:hypothetical protein
MQHPIPLILLGGGGLSPWSNAALTKYYRGQENVFSAQSLIGETGEIFDLAVYILRGRKLEFEVFTEVTVKSGVFLDVTSAWLL